MKRAIDVKSLVIGVLAAALFFTIIIVAKSRNNANFDTITAKTIKIVNPEGKTVAFLGSVKGTGMLGIHNKEGKLAAVLGSGSEGGTLDIYNKEGKTVAVLGTTETLKGGGVLGIFNKHGNPVVLVRSNKDSDGAINLFDRYGKLGWDMTGKR